MKIFKEKQHSFFPRPFGIRDKLYLSVGVMVFFDLTDPGGLLTEQELWKTLPAELGPKPVLDQGIPKPRAEVLVTGSCFAPRGTTRPASQVRVRVGEVDKTLNVFGDRYWKNGIITKAEDFVEMPIVWANAFGGQGFERNPLGKGIHKAPMPDGSQAVPLPNLELPAQQIGSPGQTPDPAGFGPLDLMWPQRAKKNGTYDEKWKTERWPYFPDDMNYEFFNMASEDQFARGYFEGGEAVAIENMHPDLRVIQSVLPSLRMRCFVTRDTAFKPHSFPAGPLPSHQLRETDEFREVSTRLETVWLFPHILRGLLIYRGTTEVSDEEGGDVLRVLIRHEDKAEPPKPIEHYRDLQIQLLDRGVDMDLSAMEEALKKAETSMLGLKNIPKFADDIRQKALGNRPSMPAPEPGEMLAQSRAMLAEHSARLDSLEAMARKMLAENGHLVAIDMGVFGAMRAKIAEIGRNIENTATTLAEAKQTAGAKRTAALKETSSRLKAIKPEHMKVSGLDPDAALPPDFPFHKKVSPWHDCGMPFVADCRKALDADPDALRALTSLGLTRQTIHRAWLGVNVRERREVSADWGLKQPGDFALPVGLVLPRFDGPVLNRILCRAGHPETGEDVLAPGSDEIPLFLQSATLIDLPTMPGAKAAPVVCAGDELQALLLEQEVGDCCSVIALASPKETPGKEAAEALKAAQAFLVVMPAGWAADPALKQAWEGWKSAHPSAEPLELESGRTLFEARRKGADIRGWVLEHLPKAYAGEHSVALARPEPGTFLSKDFLKGFRPEFPNIRALADGILGEVKQSMEAKFAPLKARQEQALDEVRKLAAKAEEKGVPVDMDAISLAPSGQPRPSPTAMAKAVADTLRAKRDRLRELGHLTPAIEQAFDENVAKAEALGAQSEAMQKELTAQFEAKKLELEQGLGKLKAMAPPDAAREKLLKYGLDPDAIRPLTREQAQRMHEQGKSLAGAILSGVDLSGLDLSGANLDGCQLRGTNLRGTRLDGASLVQALAGGADLSQASLKGAVLERGVFTDAVFRQADLTGAKARQALFKGCDFSGATLRRADLDMATLENVDLTGATLAEARVNMCLVSGKADGADFRSARITKSLFKQNSLDGADFREASVNQSLLSGAKGKGVRFAGANLDKLRSGSNTELPGADFTGATLRGAGLRDTDLNGATFRGADLDGAMIENSRLAGADLSGASARHARFTKSNLEGAAMRGVNLFMGGLRKARLVETDLRGSNLFAVDFYKSVVGKTRFEAANLKRSQLQDRLGLLDEES